MDNDHGLVAHSHWVLPYSNECLNNFENHLVKLMVRSGISQRYPTSRALAPTRIMIMHTTYADLGPSCYSMHACFLFLLEVSHLLPLDTINIHGHNFLWDKLQRIWCHFQFACMKGGNQSDSEQSHALSFYLCKLTIFVRNVSVID